MYTKVYTLQEIDAALLIYEKVPRPLADLLDRYEREIILRVLVATKGNVMAACRLLGANRNTFRRRLSVLGIPRHPTAEQIGLDTPIAKQ